MQDALQNEIERMYRVSDLMVTAHSTLRDRYTVRARATELALLVGGALVAAFTFIDPAVAKFILPSSIPSTVLVGWAGIAVFVASLIQMKMDWNGRAALHGRAAESYLAFKHDLGRMKCMSPEPDQTLAATFINTRDRYEAIGSTTISLPDGLFLRLKQIHRLKVEISKALDQTPGASILVIRFRIWWRDNVRGENSSGTHT